MSGPIAHPIVGAWRLVAWRAETEGGESSLPMGRDVEGILTYTPDGTMLTIIGRPNRAAFAGDDLLGGSDAERAEAARTLIAYGGRFEIDDQDVIHHVEMSLFPNWVGSAQRRTIVLSDGDRALTLVSPPLLVDGGFRTNRLDWVRLGPRS